MIEEEGIITTGLNDNITTGLIGGVYRNDEEGRLMTKEEFWKKWMKQAFGSHIPVRLIKQKEEFLNDLNLIVQYEVDRSLDNSKNTMSFPWTTHPTFTWNFTSKMPTLEGLGHEWVFPHPDNFETAYCVCDRCGLTSEDEGCEHTCTGGITNE